MPVIREDRRKKEHWAGRLFGPVRRLLIFSFLLSPFSLGCAGFWDEVTRRDFKFQSLFVHPDPMVVLRDSVDGDERAKALRALQEPKQHGGTDDKQEVVVKILTTAAASDHQLLCRLAAVQTLGRFHDPRAVQGLVVAFESAPKTFPPNTANILQCEALKSLGATGNPKAVDLLVRVVREPPVAADVADQEKQQWQDRHIAAVHALGSFPQSQSAEALLHVMRTEKDAALRNGAHESLQTATGKNLPADPKAWDELIHSAGYAERPRQDSSPIIKLLGWFTP